MKSKFEEEFIEQIIKELPQYGIDTSNWEYNYGDCCYGGAVEFLSRCIKGYAEEIAKGNKNYFSNQD